MSYRFYKTDNEGDVSAITANALKETTQDADGPVVYQFSSAIVSNAVGTVRPSVFAVLRLKTNSKVP